MAPHRTLDPGDEYLDGRDVAAVLGVTLTELKRLAASPGGLPILEVSQNRVRVRASELDAWERRRTVGADAVRPLLSAQVRRLTSARRPAPPRPVPLLRAPADAGAAPRAGSSPP